MEFGYGKSSESEIRSKIAFSGTQEGFEKLSKSYGDLNIISIERLGTDSSNNTDNLSVSTSNELTPRLTETYNNKKGAFITYNISMKQNFGNEGYKSYSEQYKVSNSISSDIEKPAAEPEVYSTANKKLIEIESLLSLINANKLMSEIFETSKTYKIQKFFKKNSILNELKESLSSDIFLVGIKGTSFAMKKLLNLSFKEMASDLPDSEGIYLFLNQKKTIGLFAFITPEEEDCKKRLAKSSSSLIDVIKILSDLCQKIVACPSNELIDKWLNVDEGKINPIILLFNPNMKITFENIILQDSSLSKKDMESNLKIIDEFPKELIGLNDISDLNSKINQFFSKIKIQTYDATIYEIFRIYFEGFLKKKRKLIEKHTKKIFDSIQTVFLFKQGYPYNEIRERLSDGLANCYSQQLTTNILYLLEKKVNYNGPLALKERIGSYYKDYIDYKCEQIVKFIFIYASQNFELLRSLPYYYFWEVTLEDKKEELLTKLLSCRQMNREEFINCIYSKLSLYIKDQGTKVLENRIYILISNFIGDYEALKKKLKQNCKSALSFLKAYFSEKMKNSKKECQDLIKRKN